MSFLLGHNISSVTVALASHLSELPVNSYCLPSLFGPTWFGRVLLNKAVFKHFSLAGFGSDTLLQIEFVGVHRSNVQSLVSLYFLGSRALSSRTAFLIDIMIRSSYLRLLLIIQNLFIFFRPEVHKSLKAFRRVKRL